MSTTFTIKRGDTLPVLSSTLLVDNVAVDLTQATSVMFFFSRGGVTLERAATISATPTDGVASYTFQLIDYGTLSDSKFEVGKYKFETQATFIDGSVLSFPTTGYNTVIVSPDLAD